MSNYYKKYGNKMMCFSPPVMLATFLIEIGFAAYVVWRYKLTDTTTRLVALMLVFLGLFQLAEYMICGGLGLNHSEWARLGYASISLLPAIGIHLMVSLAKAKMYPLLLSAYGTAAAYVVYYAMVPGAVVAQQCAANYAVFTTDGWAGSFYALYYYGWLLAALLVATHLSRKTPKAAPALRWMAIGYASFIVPVTIANLIDPATIHAIPSIMCGFAVLFACILVWRVLPLARAMDAKPKAKAKKAVKSKATKKKK